MNPYKIVEEFEIEMCKYTGSPYAVAVDSCSAALFLCCLYVKVKDIPEVKIPAFTYPSVPAAIIHAGGRVKFVDFEWQSLGWYFLGETNIVDSAKMLNRNMYIELSKYDMIKDKNLLICLSFHDKKALPIGRGGMILLDNKEIMEWLKLMRFDGRHQCPLSEDTLAMAGWNMYLQPEQAARGLVLMQNLKDINICAPDIYQNLSKYSFFTNANRQL